MAKYEIKMKMLRTGEVTSLNDDAGYDPMKDLMSHNSSLKVRAGSELQSGLAKEVLTYGYRSEPDSASPQRRTLT